MKNLSLFSLASVMTLFFSNVALADFPCSIKIETKCSNSTRYSSWDNVAAIFSVEECSELAENELDRPLQNGCRIVKSFYKFTLNNGKVVSGKFKAE